MLLGCWATEQWLMNWLKLPQWTILRKAHLFFGWTIDKSSIIRGRGKNLKNWFMTRNERLYHWSNRIGGDHRDQYSQQSYAYKWPNCWKKKQCRSGPQVVQSPADWPSETILLRQLYQQGHQCYNINKMSIFTFTAISMFYSKLFLIVLILFAIIVIISRIIIVQLIYISLSLKT